LSWKIGINPNLTAFGHGPMDASWRYAGFSSDGGPDLWTKWADYYRYRSVFQEHFNVAFVSQYLV
jgi:hypothetical protein